MEPLRAGVIGCGGHAQAHLRMIREEPELHLAAVAEPDPDRRERARREWEPDACFADAGEMLDRCALDVVYVVTQPGHLLPLVLECLERGLHVSVEKPPGM